MSEVLQIAYNVITPILLCAAAGYWFGKQFKPDPRIIARMVLFVTMPALAFDILSKTEIELGQMGLMALVVLGMAIGLLLIGSLLAIPQKLQPTTHSAFLLTIILVNSGNYGLPFVEFAFGQAGLERAALVFVLTIMVTNTFGIYVASSGTATIKQGIRNIFMNPLPYATVGGFLVNVTGFAVPLPVERAIGIFADGAVPVMLLMLGVQLSQISFDRAMLPKLRAVFVASGTRLLITPVIIFLLTSLLGVDGLTQKVMIVQLSMPTAVNAAVLSNEYGSDISFVTPAIFISTLSSIVTLSVLMVIVT